MWAPSPLGLCVEGFGYVGWDPLSLAVHPGLDGKNAKPRRGRGFSRQYKSYLEKHLLLPPSSPILPRTLPREVTEAKAATGWDTTSTLAGRRKPEAHGSSRGSHVRPCRPHTLALGECETPFDPTNVCARFPVQTTLPSACKDVNEFHWLVKRHFHTGHFCPRPTRGQIRTLSCMWPCGKGQIEHRIYGKGQLKDQFLSLRWASFFHRDITCEKAYWGLSPLGVT